MAAPPPYHQLYPPTPTSEPPHCNCHNNPVITRQQCPRCINSPKTNVHWPPPTPPIQMTDPSGPGYVKPRKGFPPIFHSPSSPSHSPAYKPSSSCTSCTSCSSGHPRQEYQPKPIIVSRNYNGPSKGGLKSYYWVDTFSRGGVPSTALHGGHDIDGTTIYVGRAFHEGDWLPAKVIPEKNVAYVAYGGAEHAKHQYQVLCEQRFDWVPSSGGHIPPGAVEGGKTSDGESLYIGRVHHDGALTVGKVHPSHGVCYIPFDGREIGHHGYEVLVLRN